VLSAALGGEATLQTANFSLAREQASRCPRKSEPGLEIGVELSSARVYPAQQDSVATSLPNDSAARF